MTILWPPFVGWMFFCSLLFRILSRTRVEKYLKDVAWVESLCANGKLALAIERAEKNIKVAEAADKLKNQSYSYVYKVFKR